MFLPKTTRASNNAASVVAGAEVVVLVPPSGHLRAVSAAIAAAVAPDAIVVVATKGIEEGSLQLMSQVLAQTMPRLDPERLAFLSGPTFAREVARGLPTDVVVASSGMVAARKVQQLVHAVSMRVQQRDRSGCRWVGGEERARGRHRSVDGLPPARMRAPRSSRAAWPR